MTATTKLRGYRFGVVEHIAHTPSLQPVVDRGSGAFQPAQPSARRDLWTQARAAAAAARGPWPNPIGRAKLRIEITWPARSWPIGPGRRRRTDASVADAVSRVVLGERLAVEIVAVAVEVVIAPRRRLDVTVTEVRP